MPLFLLDYAIIAVIAVSGLLAAMRGFVHVSLSLLAWVVGIWVGIAFMSPLSRMLAPHIGIPLLRQSIAFFALFALVVVAASVLIKITRTAVNKAELGPADCTLGMVVGCARGALIVILLALFLQLTPLSQQPVWQQSRLLPYFLWTAGELRGVVPQGFKDGLRGLKLPDVSELISLNFN